MIEGVTAHEENLCQLLVVVSHHSWSRRLLRQGKQVVNILDGTECLLPELELDGGVELRETSIEVVLQCVGIREVDGMWLMCILCDIRKMQTKSLAETAELDFPLVLQTELECLLGDLLHRQSCYVIEKDRYRTNLVDSLQPRIVFQSLESSPVALPKELEPRRNQSPVCPILGLIAAHRTE